MNLDSTHYVPILKWKRAEQGALKDLRDNQKTLIMPLVEVVRPKPKTNPSEASPEVLDAEAISIFRDQKAGEIGKEILDYWGSRPILVDFTLLYPSSLKTVGVDALLPQVHELGIGVTPVVNLEDEGAYHQQVYAASRSFERDVCLRISSADLEDVSLLNQKLETFLNNFRLCPDAVYILVDLKETADSEVYKQAAKKSQDITHLASWKGFIFANGSFPEDLTECKRDEDNMLPRQDWVNWLQQRDDKNTKRVPTFADYAIRHPIFKESLLFLASTASIKYTLPESWLVVKGQRQKYEQYLAGASVVAGSDAFYGENFSGGDKFIAEKSQHFLETAKNTSLKKKPGNTEQWLKAGMNHHLALVVHQLASRP